MKEIYNKKILYEIVEKPLHKIFSEIYDYLEVSAKDFADITGLDTNQYFRMKSPQYKSVEPRILATVCVALHLDAVIFMMLLPYCRCSTSIVDIPELYIYIDLIQNYPDIGVEQANEILCKEYKLDSKYYLGPIEKTKK